jgi:non-lysosomal glucosylceramidase
MNRRQFMKLTGLVTGGAAVTACRRPNAFGASTASSEVSGSFLGPTVQAVKQGHIVPTDKKMSSAWVKSLQARGERKIYRGKELFTIGMPCGGVGAGQLYVRGDGTLGKWWIFNNARNERHCSGYQTYRPQSPIEQGFAIRLASKGDKPQTAVLSQADFDAIEFVGEYPIAEIRFKRNAKPALAARITQEVFSPWIPLNARDSANPATVIRFTIENTSGKPVEASIAGWLQNGVCLAGNITGKSRNTVVRTGGMTCVRMDMDAPPKTTPRDPRRKDIAFDSFEDGTFDKWRIEGDAFDKAPREIAKHQHPQHVSGHGGKYLADSLGPKGIYDKPTGKLISKSLKIERRYICFSIAGGKHAGKTCMNLRVAGKVVRSSTGANSEKLTRRGWDVGDLAGKKAVLEIVDAHSGGWGHVLVDDIVLTDTPPARTENPTGDPGWGDMALSALDKTATACAAWESREKFLAGFASRGKVGDNAETTYPLGEARCGVVASSVSLKPGESKQLTFLVTWCFPNRYRHKKKVGQMYANWYDNALEAARYVARNFQRLDTDTHLFRDTYFQTTLPYWLVHRIGMPLANLATGTTEWWSNGRFYGWEGVMCCQGTCTHVWHYEQATGRLFPELAGSMREMQNIPSMDPKTGIVRFRGQESRSGYAADGQGGVILMFYRQHLMSTTGEFLKKHWASIKKMMACMIGRDGADGRTDGIVNTSDHTTYDINFTGANTHNGSMYLAALRACEKMASLQGENDLAAEYRRIYQSGAKLTVARQFNGDYFIQLLENAKSTKWQIGDGCLTSQLLGNGWCEQVNLDSPYPEPVIRKTLASIFRYNWIPDVGPYYKLHKPEMIFVKPGEAGLLICTYPLGSRLAHPLRYRNTIMQGYDYDAANQMLAGDMLTEGLAIYRANHDNYNGVKHNPWNEQQCGDHYARAMTAWGALIAISGFAYDGPAGIIGFTPTFKPDNFRAFFTAAEGWGSLVQKRTAGAQENRFEVKWGKLSARTLVFTLPEGKKLRTATVAVAGKQADATTRQDGLKVTIDLGKSTTILAGQNLTVVMKW